MFKRIVLLVFLPVLFISCRFSDDKKTINYANSEIEMNEKIINDILESSNLENVEIFSIAHFRYGQYEISKKIHSEFFRGKGFNP